METNRSAEAVLISRVELDADAQVFADIAAVQAELATAFQLLADGVRESSTGFLISAYKPEDFREFIRGGGLVLGARTAERGPLVGYLLANSGAAFLANHPATKILWDDAASEAGYGALYTAGHFSYLDQIGVARSFHGSGVAQALHRRFLEIVPRPILAAVVQEPLRNTRSTVFFSSRTLPGQG